MPKNISEYILNARHFRLNDLSDYVIDDRPNNGARYF